jgi:tRNA threonylcarbamoyladenosine biosynthesis protein TsaB
VKPINIIAWDTATPCCTAALVRFDGSQIQTLAEFKSEFGVHSQILPPQLERLIQEADLEIKDLDLIAVGRGPGSFTGLRTGLALAKGLAFGTDRPVVGISTLEVMAVQILAMTRNGETLAAPVIDAHHREVFVALYQKPTESTLPLINIMNPRPLAPTDLIKVLDPALSSQKIILAGSTLPLIQTTTADPWPENLILWPEPLPPSAPILAHLAARLFITNPEKASTLNPPIPLYIRDPQIRKLEL